MIFGGIVFAQSIEARCLVDNEDVVGASPVDNNVIADLY